MIELGEYISGFERLLRSVEGRSPITIKSYCAKVEEFFGWYRENKSVSQVEMSEIVRQDVEAYLEYCYYRDNKNRTRLTKLIAIQRFSRYLVYEGIIEADFAAGIPRPKIRKGLLPNFTKEEILKLFAVMDPSSEKGLRDINMLILGAFCGLRISEIINLGPYSIDDEEGAVDINVIGKFDSRRTVYLWKSPSLFIRQLLTLRMSQGAEKGSPLLVGYRKGDNATTSRLTAPGIDKILKQYAEKAGIKKKVVSMHMLRRRHATDLRYVRGYDPVAIMERMGWENLSTVQIYITTRGRIPKEYPSLAVYWKEFNHLWRENIAECQDKD
jgi:integrase/recombinase XerD